MATESPAAPKAPRKRAAKAIAAAAPDNTVAAAAEPAAAPKKKAAAPRKAAAPKKKAAVVTADELLLPELAAEVDEQAAMSGEVPQETPVEESLGLSKEERIRLAAYRRYEARGYAEGHQLQDWIEAEREVSDRHA